MELASIIILAGILLFIAGRGDNPVEQKQKKESEEKEE
jgi:hypothetical protein